jgi:RNA polymerase sigma factor (sigma-70 family)
MPPDPSFDELIRRVGVGDDQAAARLVRDFEPVVRRVLRARLRENTRARREFDSMDICQSVMASFFVRAALGQYELDAPEQLLKLLATMARHKLADQVDKERAECRDNRRVEEGSADTREVVASATSPSRQVAARELLEEVQRRLSPEERRLVDMRNQGLEWTAIAAELGGSPEALRKRLARATDRIAQELGLDESDHD